MSRSGPSGNCCTFRFGVRVRVFEADFEGRFLRPTEEEERLLDLEARVVMAALLKSN